MSLKADLSCIHVALLSATARGMRACMWPVEMLTAARCKDAQAAMAARKGPAAAAAVQEPVPAPAVGVCLLEEEDVLGTGPAPSCSTGALPDAAGSGALEGAGVAAGEALPDDPADDAMADAVAGEPAQGQAAAGMMPNPCLCLLSQHPWRHGTSQGLDMRVLLTTASKSSPAAEEHALEAKRAKRRQEKRAFRRQSSPTPLQPSPGQDVVSAARAQLEAQFGNTEAAPWDGAGSPEAALAIIAALCANFSSACRCLCMSLCALALPCMPSRCQVPPALSVRSSCRPCESTGSKVPADEVTVLCMPGACFLAYATHPQAPRSFSSYAQGYRLHPCLETLV